MSRAKFAVHHFVANLTTRQYGSNPTSDLLGVDYWFVIPPDLEFPRRIEKIDLFTRFYVYREGRARLVIRIRGLGTHQKTVSRFGTFLETFGAEKSVHDRVFRLPNVTIPFAGTYEISLLQLSRSRWGKIQKRILATTHFRVERQQ